MKDFFGRPLTLAVLLFLAIYGLLYYHTERQAAYYNDSALPYLEQALQEISTWQAEDLRRHLSPEALQVVTEEQLQGVLARHQPLGRFYRLETVSFSRLAAVLSIFSSATRIGYEGQAVFQNGDAALTVTLVPVDIGYKIYNINLTPRLAPPTAP